jgi:hypothetical protein
LINRFDRNVRRTSHPRNRDSALGVLSPVFAHEERPVSQRELIEPHKGDKRYQRRDEKGQFSDSDDQSRSLGQDVKRHSSTKKPRNEGDKGD